MKIGDLVKVKNRTIEYTGVIIEIKWERTSSPHIFQWKKKGYLIQCKNGKVRATIEDLEVL